MAVLAVFRAKGFTKQMYNDLIEVVDWEKTKPGGAIVHVCAFDENGDICVSDVWESEAHLNEFVQNHLIPTMRSLDIPQPEASIYLLHNMEVTKAVEKYVL